MLCWNHWQWRRCIFYSTPVYGTKLHLPSPSVLVFPLTVSLTKVQNGIHGNPNGFSRLPFLLQLRRIWRGTPRGRPVMAFLPLRPSEPPSPRPNPNPRLDQALAFPRLTLSIQIPCFRNRGSWSASESIRVSSWGCSDQGDSLFSWAGAWASLPLSHGFSPGCGWGCKFAWN